jgi:hypothetical protein
MKELTPEQMKQISGGLMPQPQFGPGLIAEIILRALFTDFGAEKPPPVMVW